MALTQYYCDPAINANSGTGTIGDPFGDLQYALNTIVRDAVNGDQVNVKVGTAEVLGASLTLATYGTPAAGAPLVIRGYTAAANDGGRAEIDCGGNTFWAANYAYFALIDLQMHTFGNNHGVNMGVSNPTLLARCAVHAGASSPTSKYLVNASVSTAQIIGCHIYNAGTTGRGIYSNQPCRMLYNYVDDCPTGITLSSSIAIGNIVRNCAKGLELTSSVRGTVIGNIVCHTGASTGTGIEQSGATSNFNIVLNNIVTGYSGVGGKGISTAADTGMIGYNAIYNCTTPTSYGGDNILDLTANDVTLLADPFTNAAGGDFSLTAAAKTALRGVGWPAAYLGAHANTDGHITIGAIQYGESEAGGAGVFRRAMRMIGG